MNHKSLASLALVLIATASVSAHASYDKETAEPLPDGSETSAGYGDDCDVIIPWGDPLPPEEPGLTYCHAAPPGSGELPSQYDYAPDRIGHEESYADICGSGSGLTTFGIAPRTPTAGTASGDWEASWSVGKAYGGEIFGAGAELGAYVKAAEGKPASGKIPATADRIEAGAALTATVTVFGQTDELVDIGADADAEYGKEAHGHARVFVAGVVAYEASKTIPLSLAVNDTFPLLSASTVFTIGPVPATITGSVVGEIGLNGATGPSVTPEGTGVKVEGTPYARLFAEASLAVGIKGVLGAGVDGQLTMLKVAAPSAGELLFDASADVRWSLDSDLELSTMSGSIVAWVQAIAKFKLPLAEWEGFTTTIPLFHLGNCRTAFGS